MTFSRLDGPADAPVVVLSNSLGTTLEMWEPQMAALSERFAVLRYDHPGHGKGRGDAPARSVEALARGVLGILDERGLARVSFCGLSLGGAVGMWLAMNAPERIDRLVLACTSARFGLRENWLQRAETVRAQGFETVADAVRAAVVHAGDAPRAAGARERLPRDDGLGRPRGLRRLLRGARRLGSRETSWRRSARRRSCSPGSEDPATPPDQAEAIARRIPGRAAAASSPAPGHLANLEQPGAFNRPLARSSDARDPQWR